MNKVGEVCFDIETIRWPAAVPFIPERKPNERSDPWDKCKTDPNYTMVAVAAFFDGNTYWSVGLDDTEGDEAELLKLIWSKLDEYRKYITFNGRSFDVPFLMRRSWFNHIKPIVNISLRKYDTQFSNHIDVRDILGNWDNYARGNLDLYCQLKLGVCKDDITGADVQRIWDEGNYAKVHEKCEKDVQFTWKLYESLYGFYLFNE